MLIDTAIVAIIIIIIIVITISATILRQYKKRDQLIRGRNKNKALQLFCVIPVITPNGFYLLKNLFFLIIYFGAKFVIIYSSWMFSIVCLFVFILVCVVFVSLFFWWPNILHWFYISIDCSKQEFSANQMKISYFVIRILLQYLFISF